MREAKEGWSLTTITDPTMNTLQTVSSDFLRFHIRKVDTLHGCLVNL